MSKMVLIMLMLMAIIQGQEQHSIDSQVQVVCTITPTPLYFKLMRKFTLVLQNNDLKDNFQAFAQSKGAPQCKLSLDSPICDFENMERQVQIRCDTAANITLLIIRPEAISSDAKVVARYIELVDEQFERAIVSVLVENDLETDVKINYSSENIGSTIFTTSPCVKNIALFEDHFRIAVEKTEEVCIIGIRKNIEAQWSLKKATNTVTQLEANYSDYCPANASRNYSLTQSNNFTVQILVQSDIDKILEKLEFTVTFHGTQKADQVFRLTNFEKGVDPFMVKVHCNLPANSVTFSSNIDIFYLFSFSSTVSSYLGLEQDEYIYTNFKPGFEFSVELDNFDRQSALAKSVKLYLSPDAPKNISFKYAECSDELCTNHTSFMPATGMQFKPKCETLFEQFCFVKIYLISAEEGKYGMIAHVPIEHQQIEVNRYHHGTLQKDAIRKYIIKKETLEKGLDEFLVMAQGVHIYLTYDPQCRRIACAQYDVRNGYKQIPNQKKDLYIYLQGTTKIKYHFVVDLKDNKFFTLSDGILTRSFIGENDTYKYFTYKVTKPQLGLEINCNAPFGAVQLILSKNLSNFADFNNLNDAYRSQQCFIYVPPRTFTQGDNMHISLRRMENHHGKIDFSLVAVPEGQEVYLDYNTPYYDYIQPNGKKLLTFHVYRPAITDEGIAFKIDIPDAITGAHHLNISFGNEKDNIVDKVEWDLQTVYLQKPILNQICTDPDQKKLCKVFVRMQNSEKRALQLDVLLWVRQEPVMLYNGRFINFDTGALHDETHFYFDVAHLDKPINLYISSTEVEIEALWSLYVPQESKSMDTWPFPTFPIDVSSNKLQTHSFTYASYIGPSILASYAQKGKRLVVLLTVRDHSRLLTHQTFFEKGEFVNTRGSIQLIYTTGQVDMREDDKLQYYLHQGQHLNISFDLSNILSETNKSVHQQIEFYNTRLMGVGDISVKYFLMEDNMKVGDQVKAISNSSVIPIKLSDLKKHLSTVNLTKNYKLVFLIESIKFNGKYICNIVTSYSEYREITLGVPEDFHIKPNSSVIFQFADMYNKRFRIKVNRRQGFPDYKIVSCASIDNISQCIKQLDRRNISENDPSRIIVGGRSHELFINSKSEVYCKRCRYYIAFYSDHREVDGSITIIRSNQAVMLIEGKTLTTEVSLGHADTYNILVEPNKDTKVHITAHMGTVIATLIDPNSAGPKRQTIEQITVENNSTAEMKVPQSLMLNVISRDSSDALYTIFYASEDFPVALQDGMPIHINRYNKGTINNNFRLKVDNEATLVVMSQTPLNISVHCQDQKQKNSINTESSQSVNNITSSLINQVQHSLIWNTTSVALNALTCKNYLATIQGIDKANYVVVVSGSDIVFLPVETLMPGRLARGQTRIYEVPIAESTHIKISMRLCTKGQMKVGLTYDKADLKTKDYDSTFDINMEQDYQVYTHKARPGILYIVVKSVSKQVDYTIEIFSIRSQQQLDDVQVYLEDSGIHYQFNGILTPLSSQESIADKAKTTVTKILDAGKEFDYQIQFTPLKIESQFNQYDVSYIIVESLTKETLQTFVRCRGAALSTPTNEQQKIYSQENIVVPGISSSEVLPDQKTTRQKVSYKSQFEQSYISIIPIIKPKLPASITFEPYHVVKLGGHSMNPFAIAHKTVSAIYSFLEARTPLKNTILLYIFTAAIVMALLSIILALVVSAIGFVTYNWRTREYRQRSRPLAQNEFELRLPGAVSDNALDMVGELEKTDTTRDLSQPRGKAQLV